MSWLFSQALVEEYSAVTCSDGEPSALLSGKHTNQAYLPQDRMKDFSPHSLSGMTYKPLTENRGEELLTSYLAGFHAKTLARLEQAKELTDQGQACGRTWQESWAKYDPNTSSWKTRQCSLLGGLDEFSETYPKWGSMRNGEFWGHLPLVACMDGHESGLSLPTPLKSDGRKFLGFKKKSVLKATFGTHVNSIPYAMTARYGRIPSAEVISWVMAWPIGWASLNPLETDKYQSWLQQHSLCYPANKEAA